MTYNQEGDEAPVVEGNERFMRGNLDQVLKNTHADETNGQGTSNSHGFR